MNPILAEFDGQEQARARADENAHVCDFCHSRNGLRFIDQHWACEECAWSRVLLGLRLEQARTSPAFAIKGEPDA